MDSACECASLNTCWYETSPAMTITAITENAVMILMSESVMGRARDVVSCNGLTYDTDGYGPKDLDCAVVYVG